MSQFNFQQVLANINFLKNDLPILMANKAKNYFLSSFKQQGWEGSSWQEVNRRIEGTKAYKYPSKPKASSRKNPILIRTGKLRRAVSNSIRTVTFEKIQLIVDLPYAVRHNEGTDGMPQRKYMGDSEKLRSIMKDEIDKALKKLF